MAAPELDFDMYQADTKNINVSVVDNSGVAVSLAGVQSIQWQMSKWNSAQTAFSASPVVSKAIGTGITVTDSVNGKLTIALAVADTDTLSAGQYYHELEVIDSIGECQTVLFGTINLLKTLIKD